MGNRQRVGSLGGRGNLRSNGSNVLLRPDTGQNTGKDSSRRKFILRL
jgi:hypothetical protein